MTARSRLVTPLLVATVAACLMSLTACAAPPQAEQPVEQQQAAETAPQPIQEDALYKPEYQPTGKEIAVIKTSKGTIKVQLFGADAPVHVGNFVELARKGFYDGTKFHRYEPGFVIQGGDPQTKDMEPEKVVEEVQSGMTALGTGGPGYTIKAEYDPAVNPNKHEKGALGMARSQMPDSAGSQFYFALEPLPMLDANYTVFGRITEGADVMAELRVGDVIESVTIEGAE